jgi:hypothetical protein
MLTTKNNYKMIALGLLLIFICPQTLLCDQEAVLGVKKIEAPTEWEEFNYNEVAPHREWHEKMGNTFKQTSVTGKGPLWARVATSITTSKTENGDPMFGFKMKL